MGYYPIFLDVGRRACLVVGGGSVAERKVTGLLQAEAKVTVLSPRLTSQLRQWVEQGVIQHVGREYRQGDMAGYALVFAATDEGLVNGALFEEGKACGVWVNSADDPRHCDFILPSILRRGDLIVAVATGGSSPALSRAIKNELEAYFTEDYAALVRLAAEVRQQLRTQRTVPDATAWQRALNGQLRQLIREGHLKEAKNYLLACLEEAACR